MNVPLTLLGLLEREPSHGYDLKRDYDTYFGRGKPLRYSQVYATLGRLTRDGKAVPGPVEQGAGPERRRYVITGAGVADVEEWLSEPAQPEPDLQSELFAKVVLSLMLDRAAGRYLDIQRAAHLQRMRELTDLKSRGDPWTCCSPTLPSSAWRPTCAGSTTRRSGWTCSRRRCVDEDPPDEGPGEKLRPDPGVVRRHHGSQPGRDPRGHGPERIREVHPAALPGLHPGPRRWRGLVRRPAPGHPQR